MKIAALQFDIAWEDRERNYSRVRHFAKQAQTKNADLLVLPEMFATGFSLNPSVTAEEVDGPTTRFLKTVATEFDLDIIAGATFKASLGKALNCAVVFDRTGKRIACYSKMKLFSFAGENLTHIPGESPVVFKIGGLNAACFICYDLRFPSLFEMVAKTCDVVFVIASWPKSRSKHWDILIPARAVENQLYVVGVNRVGEGDGLSYNGGTQIVSPLGDQIVHAQSIEQLVFAEIDPMVVKRVREEMPFLADR